MTLRLSLHKRYADAVLDDGTSLVYYAARFSFGAVSLPYTSLTWQVPGQPAQVVQQLRRASLSTQADAMQVTHGVARLSWQRLHDPATPRLTLYEEPAGAMRWQAHMPHVKVSVQGLNGSAAELNGLGYVESIEVDLWPTRWPIRVLHWGRFVGQLGSLVWIRWEHEHPRQWLFWQGKPVVLHQFDLPRQLTFDGGELRLTQVRSVISQPVAQRLRLLGPLQRVFPARVRRLREDKQLASGTLHLADGRTDHGHVMFETVEMA